MRLVVFSHKPCWRSPGSPSGFATDGGFPFQMKALSELFDTTVLLVPCLAANLASVGTPLTGNHLSVVPLSWPPGQGIWRKLLFPFWVLSNLPGIVTHLWNADAVHAPIPGDVGTVGMLGAFLFRKPLFVRYCGNWSAPRTVAERLWRWSMETSARGRNVMLATGGASSPPSQKNPNVRWIFSTSLTEEELSSYACQRTYPFREPIDGPPGFGVRQPSGALEQLSGNGKRQGAAALQDATAPKPGLSRFNAGDQVRLIIVARQEPGKGTDLLLRALPLLHREFPGMCMDIVGGGSALAGLKVLATSLSLEDSVRFYGSVPHGRVLELLRSADLFCFPSASEGFPKVVLEALACGLPVVATPVSVLPQLLGTGCGVLIEKPSPEALAHGIRLALASPEVYEQLSRQAIETAKGYSLEAWRNAIGVQLATAWGTLKTQKSTPSSHRCALPVHPESTTTE